MLPDGKLFVLFIMVGIPSQCTYRCVVLPDTALETLLSQKERASQCTYRCVVLPDNNNSWASGDFIWSQCTYRCVVLPDQKGRGCLAQPQTSLNAPTGAWCSLTRCS